jgi:hypothetical protein
MVGGQKERALSAPLLPLLVAHLGSLHPPLCCQPIPSEPKLWIEGYNPAEASYTRYGTIYQGIWTCLVHTIFRKQRNERCAPTGTVSYFQHCRELDKIPWHPPPTHTALFGMRLAFACCFSNLLLHMVHPFSSVYSTYRLCSTPKAMGFIRTPVQRLARAVYSILRKSSSRRFHTHGVRHRSRNLLEFIGQSHLRIS